MRKITRFCLSITVHTGISDSVEVMTPLQIDSMFLTSTNLTTHTFTSYSFPAAYESLSSDESNLHCEADSDNNTPEPVRENDRTSYRSKQEHYYQVSFQGKPTSKQTCWKHCSVLGQRIKQP